MHRGDEEAWDVQQVDESGRKNFLVSRDGRWLATRNEGEQGFFLASSPTAASIWELIPVPGETSRFYLRSIHGRHLASLDDKEQTLYMSPGQKEWERWRVLPLGAPAAGAAHALLEQRHVPAGCLRVLLEERGQLLSCPVDEAVERLLLQHQPSKAISTMMRHNNPEQPLVYGRWFGLSRAPCVFVQGYGREVTDYLCDDPVGPLANLQEWPPCIPMRIDDPWTRWSFESDDDEKLLKADWHAVPHLNTEDDFFVPRHAQGRRIMRAPPRILAFIMAFRAINQPCWSVVMEALRALRRAREQGDEEYKREGRGRLLGTFIECFRNKRHFGVVEAQIRWGGERLRQPSHMDGATSLVHLGLTLGGARRLRSGVFPAKDTVSSGKNVWDESVWAPAHLQDAPMLPGSAYLSSPFCFEHAVEYEPCSATEPMVALMCRFGFPKDLGPMINNMRGDDMLDITTVVAASLKAACTRGLLRLPTVAEVQQFEEQIMDLDMQRAHNYG
mmetsp:Transcript_52266/g.163880  ORF Transcript_52266/g.163880 Transcript_52266/m.163880 type:complete len:501 (+) Transcript_52266:1-1503(+)